MDVFGKLEPVKTIQDRIKYLRIVNDMSMIEVGDRMYLTREQISDMEKGRRSIQYQEIQYYSAVFDVSPNWLVNGKE